MMSMQMRPEQFALLQQTAKPRASPPPEPTVAASPVGAVAASGAAGVRVRPEQMRTLMPPPMASQVPSPRLTEPGVRASSSLATPLPADVSLTPAREVAPPLAARTPGISASPGKLSLMQLRREQLAAIREPYVVKPRRRIMAALWAAAPEACAKRSEGELTALVNDAIGRADHYGMGSEKGCYVFAAALLLLGPRFDNDPQRAWALPLLNDPVVSGRDKTELLRVRIFMDSSQEV